MLHRIAASNNAAILTYRHELQTALHKCYIIVRDADFTHPDNKGGMPMMMWLLMGAAIANPLADKPNANPLIEALAQCLTIKADAERLACTDVAAAKLIAAERGRELVVVTRDEVRKTKRSLFGLAIDENDVFAGREAPADRIERLETTIAAAAPTGMERWSLVLAEGGRWRTTEAWDYASPKPGMTVVVRKAAMGSYVLDAKGQRSVRVMRVN